MVVNNYTIWLLKVTVTNKWNYNTPSNIIRMPAGIMFMDVRLLNKKPN